MATAYLLYGYIGSGKTTLARSLEASLPAMRFSHDEWMVNLFGTNPPSITFHENWMKVYDLMTPLWQRLLTLGIDVIIDEGLWHRKRRDQLRSEIKALGARYKLVHVKCSLETAWQRTEKRNASLKDSFFISKETFEELFKNVESLGEDEIHEVIDTNS